MIKSLWPFVPNALGFIRALFGAALYFLILSPRPLDHALALGLFVLGALTDYFDGAIARRYGCVTGFGKILDPLADKFLVLIPLAACSARGLFSVWWVVPIFAREIVITFARFAWIAEGRSVGAEKIGKIKFGFQAVWVIASLVYVITLDDAMYADYRHPIMLLVRVLLAVSLVLTMVSGVSFIYHNRAHFQTRSFAKFTAAFGVGLMPWAPGTWGSAAALFLIGLTAWNIGLYLAVFLAILIAGYWAVSNLDPSSGRDPAFVVVDEICGMFVTLAFLPLTPLNLLVGFLLFRIFDIVKPFPVRHLERLPGYWGILADDLGAGLYARLVLLIIFRQ